MIGPGYKNFELSFCVQTWEQCPSFTLFCCQSRGFTTGYYFDPDSGIGPLSHCEISRSRGLVR